MNVLPERAWSRADFVLPKCSPDTLGNQDTFTVATMAIVLITVFALGSTTETMLSYWDIQTGVDEDEYMDSWNAQASMPELVLKFENFIEKHVIREDHLNFVQHHGAALDTTDDDDDDDSEEMDTYLTHSVRYPNNVSIHHARNTAIAHTLSSRGGIFDFGQD